MKRFKTIPLILIGLLCEVGPAAAASPRLDHERAIYISAIQDLKAGRDAEFKVLAWRDRSYILYPYLEYHYLAARLGRVPDRTVGAFLRAQAGTPLGARLRRHYLRYLAKQGQWRLFRVHYRADDVGTRLRCVHWDQLWRLPADRPEIAGKIRRFWSSATPLPSSCRGFFDTWFRQQPDRDVLVWARIQAAMKLGILSVADHLRPWLAPVDRRWLDRWIFMYQHPVKGLASIDYPVDSTVARRIIRTGIVQLGYRDPGVAMSEWLRLRRHYTFFGEDNNYVLRHLGVLAAQNHDPHAEAWLADAVPKPGDDLQVREWRVRAALWAGDWRRAGASIQTLPRSQRGQAEWRYWQARVDQHTGLSSRAHAIFVALARHRNYYGFLAADRLGIPYSMQETAIVVDEAKTAKLRQELPIRMAHELFVLGEINDALRQWNFAVKSLTRPELVAAAELAARWGWYDRAIVAINAAGENDDLALRFPMAYRSLVEASAHVNGIDPGWVYGVMRQESAFMVNAQSPVGALGLMQLMPLTGWRTARLLGLHLNGTSGILDVVNNVRLGARYLKKVLDENRGDEVLATASYNAGPDRVASWRPASRTRAADVWIDTIPYNETRNYVKSVLGFTTVYDYLLGDHGLRLRQHMTAVAPVSN